jgi:hypothetical protein
MRRIVSTFILSLIVTILLWAPKTYCLEIEISSPISSYDALVRAIVMVESGGNNLAYNPKEQATGPFQIRPIRLKDYNMRTHNNYSLNDMYDYDISKEIFLYYANKQEKDFQMIARNWNGRGPKTLEYWKQVKKHI